MLLVKFFIQSVLLMKLKHNKNKIIACAILITLLLSDIGLKNIFLLLYQFIDVLSRFLHTALCITRIHYKVAGVKVYPRRNQNNRAHAVTACIGL